MAAGGRRQGRLLRVGQRHELPGEIAGGALVAQEADHLTGDAGHGALRVAAQHLGLQRRQAGEGACSLIISI
jgi:hypothetical protein